MKKHLSIGQRLGLVLGSVLFLSAASSVYGIYTVSRMNASSAAMLNDNVQTERRLSDWQRVSTSNMQRTIAVVRSSDTTLGSYFAPAMAEATRRSTELQKSVEPQMDTPEEKALYATVSDARKTYIKTRDEMIRLKKTADHGAAEQLFHDEFEPKAAAYSAAVTALAESQRTQLDAAGKTIQDSSHRAAVTMAIGAVVSLLLGTLLAWRLTRSITAPLRIADHMARAIAELDLSQVAQTGYRDDETGRLLKSLDAMRSALIQALNGVRDVADGIATASAEIAVGNQDLSTRTEHTAGNLQQAASAIEQLTGTVRHSADSADQANALATTAVQVAHRGGEMVTRVVDTMAGIQTSSKRIADIIGTIDGIAFQTNILALNAAVEAARAGEQGRGFAVVASEVRNLAQRSAEAAKEIKTLISESVGKVETGSKLVADAGATMDQIVVSVQQVTDMIGRITATSNEQSHGIGNVNTAVQQLDQMTQQNAALVEESAAAAESLRDQAARLSGVVSTFRLTTTA